MVEPDGGRRAERRDGALRRALASWREWGRRLRRESYAVYLALRDPRLPWYARLVAILVVGYAFSPIDLIPDFVPILGYLDDLVIVPLGIALALRLIPSDILAVARARADIALAEGRPTNRTAAFVIVAIWLALATLAVILALRFLRR